MTRPGRAEGENAGELDDLVMDFQVGRACQMSK
jgi:hypothetical protein